jgi:NTP pyrophosphatase (non-canonical NTP hydrolase)
MRRLLISFQTRVRPWVMACFGERVARDKRERNHRFLEEALELVQACGCSKSEAYQIVDYVYGRETGEKRQEVGGVMVTLAALCLAHDIDMHRAGEIELQRIWGKVDQIRRKQLAKPKFTSKAVATFTPWTNAAQDVLAERERQILPLLVGGEDRPCEQDDQHKFGQLALAAAAYTLSATHLGRELRCSDGRGDNYVMHRLWPWDEARWKPKSAREDLVRAGALILAEIERIDRRIKQIAFEVAR